MARFRSEFRPGTPSYARQQAARQRQRATLAQSRAARAKSPEAKRKALRQASAARAEVRNIERREETRRSLSPHMLESFNRSTLRQQDFDVLVRRVERQYPNGVPQDVPDPFAVAGPMRGKAWSSSYSRQGIRRKNAAD